MINTELDFPIHVFHEGKNFKAYEFLGAHKLCANKKQGWVFRVWAPHASYVSVVGDFNVWDNLKHPMKKISKEIWEVFICDLKQFDNYKFFIKNKNKQMLKADPFAFHAETAPANASKLYDISGYKWSDNSWLEHRNKTNTYESPMNIYEVHLGSWKRYPNNCSYSYRDIAAELISYVKKMNYTHIELLPITEFPFEGSWGYQVTGLFAPTARYGTPEDLMYLIDMCHKNNIGVILDWVIAHFPKDEHGLYEFDGDKLFESNDELMCEHKEWGTRIFDFGKNEVQSFLISSANLWLETYHFDGIRVDAVASMLYLDYCRKEGFWHPNKFGGNYNLEAIDFLKNLNKTILSNNQGVLMIAEESTAFPMVTKPPEVGGLGFNYKWNMGWMNDMLTYMQANSFFRKDMHNNLTFSISYAYSENYILPLSHDEVVHGKKSLIDKMFGEYEDKFTSLKAFYGFMMAHPGKKMLFMGGEFAQFIEWDYQKQLDWFLLDYPAHKAMQQYVKDLNKFYLDTPALYQQDTTYDGFKWLCVDDSAQNVISFVRYAKDGACVVAVVNFSPIERKKYNLGVPNALSYKVAFSSDFKKYNGATLQPQIYKTKKGKMHNEENYITINIPALSVCYLTINEK
ncbi:MAG: 1,4-alpha-glucan branching protein GlgB [Clostridia bacterium]